MGTLVSTLEVGVSALDLDVVQGSLEALASLSRQHYLAASEGRPGIATPQGGWRGSMRSRGLNQSLPAVKIDAVYGYEN